MSGCATCGKTASLKKCSRCQSVAYCSPDCQKAHWKQHKPSCAPAQAGVLSTAQARAEAEKIRRELIKKLHLADNDHSYQDHGHSHGGKPCGGHGPPQAARVIEPPQSVQHDDHSHQAHGHSHGGKPCGGHGPPPAARVVEPANDSHSHQAHGHSHGGRPCGGHGPPAGQTAQKPKAQQQHGHAHAQDEDHGHSHGSGNHGHSHAPAAEQHGHSHNGQPCHGHGNAAGGHQGHQLKVYTNPKLAVPDLIVPHVSVNGAQVKKDQSVENLLYKSTDADRPMINGHRMPQSVTFIPLSAEQTLDPEDKDTDLRSSFCPTCAMANTGFITAASDTEKAFMQDLQDNHVEVAKGVEADYKDNPLVSFVEGAETSDISEYPDCIAEMHIGTATLPLELGDQTSTQPMTIVQLMVRASQPPPTDAEASKAFFTATSGAGRTFTRRFEFVAESSKLVTPIKLPHIALDYALASLRREIEKDNPSPLFTFPAHFSVWTDRCEWMGQPSPSDPYVMIGSEEPANEQLLRAERMQINIALQSMWKAWNIKEMEVSVFPPGHARSMLLQWQDQLEPVQRFFVQL